MTAPNEPEGGWRQLCWDLAFLLAGTTVLLFELSRHLR
jgi:hypothetical protein